MRCPIHPDRQAKQPLKLPGISELLAVCPECHGKARAGDRETIRLCSHAWRAGYLKQLEESKLHELRRTL